MSPEEPGAFREGTRTSICRAGSKVEGRRPKAEGHPIASLSTSPFVSSPTVYNTFGILGNRKDLRQMKGLNKTGDGSNRFRFNKKAQRLKEISVDVQHQTKLPDTLDTAAILPSTGSRGCHFQDQLESCKNLDSSQDFSR